MTEEGGDPFPEQIAMGGVGFDLVAVKRGYDKHGVMRYRMIYEHGGPVMIARTQMNRGMIGLVFLSPKGPVAFDFSFQEGEY